MAKMVICVPLAIIGIALLLLFLYLQGFVRFNYPSSERFPVQGIDVSHHQRHIDWMAVKASGVSFAYIKATEGSRADGEDDYFDDNSSGAKEAGIVRGAYHFFSLCSSGETQALNFMRVLSDQSNMLPPAVDVEFGSNCDTDWSLDKIRLELSRCLSEVERLCHRRPVIYVNGESFERLGAATFAGYELWVSGILEEPSRDPYGDVAIWQFANNGRIDGIETRVDLDVFFGTPGEFQALLSE